MFHFAGYDVGSLGLLEGMSAEHLLSYDGRGLGGALQQVYQSVSVRTE